MRWIALTGVMLVLLSGCSLHRKNTRLPRRVSIEAAEAARANRSETLPTTPGRVSGGAALAADADVVEQGRALDEAADDLAVELLHRL